MQTTPKSLRLHIALLGTVNSGKSSFLNLITGQQTSIISDIGGTTTDVVEKSQEFHPLGPVLWLDTAGFGDTSELANKRLQKTLQVLDRTDIALLICKGDTIGSEEQHIINLAAEKKIPLLRIYNQADKYPVNATDGIAVNSTDLSSRDTVIKQLTSALIRLCPEDFLNSTPLLGDLLPEQSTAIMIIPLDYEAPKGRLIMPQVQAIRDCLDHNQNIIMVKPQNSAGISYLRFASCR